MVWEAVWNDDQKAGHGGILNVLVSRARRGKEDASETYSLRYGWIIRQRNLLENEILQGRRSEREPLPVKKTGVRRVRAARKQEIFSLV